MTRLFGKPLIHLQTPARRPWFQWALLIVGCCLLGSCQSQPESNVTIPKGYPPTIWDDSAQVILNGSTFKKTLLWDWVSHSKAPNAKDLVDPTLLSDQVQVSQFSNPRAYCTRLAVTAINSLALVQLRLHVTSLRQSEIDQRLARVLPFLLNQLEPITPKRLRQDNNYNWPLLYSLDLLLACHEKSEFRWVDKEQTEEMIRSLVAKLQSSVKKKGGWTYVGPVSVTFMTAPILMTLQKAKALGFAVDVVVLDRGLKSIESSRLAHGGYPYTANGNKKGQIKMHTPAGTAPRGPLIECARIACGSGSVDELTKSLDQFFVHWNELEKRRGAKKNNKGSLHGGPHQIAPYYFMFDHYYAGRAIQLLPRELRDPYQQQLLDKLLSTANSRYGWTDMNRGSNLSFGTAMAALMLLELTNHND